MDHLRHQKYKNKQLENRTLELENNFNPINVSIIDLNKCEKKRRNNKEETIHTKHLS